MKIRRIIGLFLGLSVLWSGVTLGLQDFSVAQEGFTSSQQKIIDTLAKRQIIYLGETHDREADHQDQLAIIQALDRRHGRLAIAMEMFQRPAQATIDNYLAGKITELELLEQTEYEKRWGFDWKYYAPILEFARANRLPVIALNTPIEVTRKVAKAGLESLTADERTYIPPIQEIDRSNNAYRDLLFTIYQQHQKTAKINSKSFDRFYTAQLLWDETMAESVANFVRRNPDRQLIVMAGQNHIIYGHGIPSRVQRRLAQLPKGSKFTQATVLLSSVCPASPAENRQPADFIWRIDRS